MLFGRMKPIVLQVRLELSMKVPHCYHWRQIRPFLVNNKSSYGPREGARGVEVSESSLLVGDNAHVFESNDLKDDA